MFFVKPHKTLTRNDQYSFHNQKQSISLYTSVYKCRQQKAYRKMLWRTRDVIYSTEHHQREDIARYCSAHFGETINQERKLQDATRNRKVVKIRDSICQNWQEQRYKYNVTLLVKLHLLLIRFFSFCLLSPKKDLSGNCYSQQRCSNFIFWSMTVLAHMFAGTSSITRSFV